MTLPTDLAREVAERAEQPGFDVVLDRAASARRRRRRTTIASGLVAAVVVGGIAWGAAGSGPHRRSPEPAQPGVDEPWDVTSEVDTRLPTSVQSVLGDKHAHIWQIAGSGESLAVMWRACADDLACRYALVVRDGDDVSGRRVDADAPRIDAVPGGWLYQDGRGTELVSPQGELDPVVVTGPGGSASMPGDTVVDTLDGVRLLRGTKVIDVPAPGGAVVGGYVTPEGRLVVAAESADGIAVRATDDGRTWEREVTARSSEPVSGAVVAGRGDHVAVAFLGDDPDGSVPLVEVQVSDDAGRTWIPAHGLDMLGGLPVHDLTSLVVGPTGSTWVTTMSHGLIRIDDHANARVARQSSYDQAVVVVDDAVCVVAEAGRTDELRCSADDGTTWVPQPLPGFR